MDLIVYGISLAAVSGVVVALVRYFLKPTEEVVKLVAAFLAVGSYLLVENLPALEVLIPSVPVWLPQVLMGILIFGAALGFAPGETFSKAIRLFKR